MTRIQVDQGLITLQQTIYLCCLFFLFNSCGSNNQNDQSESREKGTLYISVDESFKPVIDSQIQVFESSFPEARIIAEYKPEAECLRDLGVDSIRMLITTRGYSESEKTFLEDSMHVLPKKKVIAYDAIAVIVNKQSPDSLFTMTEIKDLLKGSFKKNLIPVFDGLHATSTIRFIIDSVLRGNSLAPGTTAAKSSEGVIDYVSKNLNAVGFIGVSWIGNREDSAQLSFLTKITLASLESTDIPGAYVKPVQANIYKRRYPMVRDLVYILKENNQGLGNGFANFLSGQRGQLIFKRAYLMPAQLSFNVRNATLTQ